MDAGRTFFKAWKTEILLIKPRSSCLKIILRISLNFIFNHTHISENNWSFDTNNWHTYSVNFSIFKLSEHQQLQISGFLASKKYVTSLTLLIPHGYFTINCNIKKSYILPTKDKCVVCASQTKSYSFPKWSVFITEQESACREVRTGSLNQTFSFVYKDLGYLNCTAILTSITQHSIFKSRSQFSCFRLQRNANIRYILEFNPH
jgi:hypothetical protein